MPTVISSRRSTPTATRARSIATLAVVCVDAAGGYVWSGDVVLHEIVSEARGEHVRTFAYHDEDAWEVVAQSDASRDAIDDGEWLVFFNDGIGTPLRLVDRNAHVVAELDLTPWGASTTRATDVRFVGQLADEETGLHYNRFRHYDPEAGRFISPDPIRLAGGPELYAAPYDPYSLVDPLGLRFPDSVKQAALQANTDENGGVVKCAECDTTCVQPQKSMKGVTPPQNEWQFDHIDPKKPKDPNATPGTDTLDNCQILCRKCNRKKSNN